MTILNITKGCGMLVTAFGLLMITSCSKKNDDQPTPVPDRQEAVNFTASVSPFQEYNDNGRLQNSNINRTFGSGDDFALWAVTDNSRPTGSGTAYSYVGGQLKAVGNGLTTDGRQSAIYYAITPRTIASVGNASFTASVDQSSESTFWANDLCTATTAVTTSTNVALSFSHRLCCVCVSILGDAVTGTISQVQLNGVRLSAQLNFDGGSDQTTGATSTVQTCKRGQSYYAIVPPQSFQAGSALAVITLDGQDYEVVFDEAVTYAGGTVHYLDAYYHADDTPTFVGLTGDINPWEK